MKSKTSVSKILLLGMIVIAAVLIFGKKFSPSGSDEPVTSIQAEFVGEIQPGGKYSRSMFDVKGVTAAGRLIQITNFSASDPTAVIDEETGEAPPLAAAEHGDTCEVEIEYQGCTDLVTVNITREVSAQRNIGYPDEETASVVYYTNGDLEFTGKGKIINFGDSAPWNSLEYSHVYIDEALEIENMDGWFSGNESLVYCDPLPKTVKTMNSAFSGCESLETTPDYFQCTSLQIMDHAFDGCVSLKEADVIPVSVSSAQYAFQNCTSLQIPPALDKTSNLSDTTGMYSGCTALTEAAAVPETVTSMAEMYMNCINIKEAVKFPENVQDITETYFGCQGMVTGASVPESVTSMQKCYAGCSALTGSLEINTDTDEYSGFFDNATTNGDKLQIFGNSGNLLAIQKDSGNSSISLADPAAAAAQNERMLLERAALEGGGLL